MWIPGGATARRLIRAAARMELLPNRLRGRALERRGLRGARDSWWCAGGRVLAPERLTVGHGCFVNHEVLLDDGSIGLGPGVYIGHRAMILTATHEVASPDRRAGQPVHRDVRIGMGTWIGAGAVVLPGVTIGPGCVVAAGAVVVRHCEPNGLYAGVPARRVKEIG